MEYLLQLFEGAATVVDIFGLLLLVVGFVRGAVGWVVHEIRRLPWSERLLALRKLRCVVGVHILYALELMIVSDIISSFVAVAEYEPGGENFFTSSAFYALIQLGMVVVIRTMIEYFLSKEIESVHKVSPEPQVIT